MEGLGIAGLLPTHNPGLGGSQPHGLILLAQALQEVKCRPRGGRSGVGWRKQSHSCSGFFSHPNVTDFLLLVVKSPLMPMLGSVL